MSQKGGIASFFPTKPSNSAYVSKLNLEDERFAAVISENGYNNLVHYVDMNAADLEIKKLQDSIDGLVKCISPGNRN